LRHRCRRGYKPPDLLKGNGLGPDVAVQQGSVGRSGTGVVSQGPSLFGSPIVARGDFPISGEPPTRLVDEADTIFGPKADANENLRGLLNAGHQRNRPAKRYDAASNRVESIPTFAMAALAGIGAMPDTIEDRAVVIRMRRRAPGETCLLYPSPSPRDS